MNKQHIIKLIVYGLLQWVIFNLVLFVISLIVGVKEDAEMSAPPPLGFVLLGMIMAGIAYIFVRQLKPVNRRQAVQSGLVRDVNPIYGSDNRCKWYPINYFRELGRVPGSYQSSNRFVIGES